MGNYSSTIPTKTNMTAQIEVNAIMLENDPPGWTACNNYWG